MVSKTYNRSLAMRKLEKSFIAVMNKGYERKPYNVYPLMSPLEDKSTIYREDRLSHIDFVEREMAELKKELWAIKEHKWSGLTTEDKLESLDNVMDEIADVSNCLDYMYEHVLKEAINIVGKRK